jgi:mRNA-binding protein PUF3
VANTSIEKVLYQLDKTEREELIEQIKPLLTQLKKFSYGKQIIAIEKLLFELNSPPSSTSTSNANSSTTPPASHKSSPLPSRRSLTELESRLPVGGVAPPTPPPTDTQSQHEGSAHECSADAPSDSCKLTDTTVTTHLSHAASQSPDVSIAS